MLERLVLLPLHALHAADQVVQRVPVISSLRDCALDTLLGPPEDFEYVSTTTPPTPPPII